MLLLHCYPQISLVRNHIKIFTDEKLGLVTQFRALAHNRTSYLQQHTLLAESPDCWLLHLRSNINKDHYFDNTHES